MYSVITNCNQVTIIVLAETRVQLKIIAISFFVLKRFPEVIGQYLLCSTYTPLHRQGANDYKRSGMQGRLFLHVSIAYISKTLFRYISLVGELSRTVKVARNLHFLFNIRY